MKLYIAGPDVFRPDALHWADTVRALCHERGHEALIPLDGDTATAEGIFRNNLALLQRADTVLANLNPFRGAEPDSGTCVEIGYALALGKPVIGYAAALTALRQRVGGGKAVDADGYSVENFGLPFNLMLSVPLQMVAGDIAVALDLLAREFTQNASLSARQA
jgi:nucleoside 2-deoxyribosyltransferase